MRKLITLGGVPIPTYVGTALGALLAAVCVAGVSSAALAAPQGGVFIPRNGGYEGCMGQAHVFFDQRAGGSMSVVGGDWPKLKPIARLDMVFAVQTAGGANPIEVRQSFDRSPQLVFLEEGNERTGLRVLFKLYDADNVYRGHGMTETWLYPDGQVFVTAAATFENAAQKGPDVTSGYVGKARLDVDFAAPMVPTYVGTALGTPPVAATTMDDKAVPGRFLFFAPAAANEKGPDPKLPGLALYWKSGKMEHNTFIFRSAFGQTGAPCYYRWPDYFRQAYGVGAWVDRIVPTDKGVQLLWPAGPGKGTPPTASFNTLFRLAVVPGADAAKAFVEAEREPVKLTVTGGVIHGGGSGYNDQEGCYEVRKTGDPLTISLPADPRGRTIRVKAIALSKHGAVTAALDGKPLVPQLTTDGGIADDPLAPIREQPEAPADAAMVAVKLTDKPQTLLVKEEDGIQLVYQSRDAWRNFAIYSTKTGPRWSGLRFSLVDGHARNMRGYGRSDWALSENLLHWFSYCGYTPEQMLDQLRDFVIVKNGPDEIIYKYTSSNACDGARSEYVVAARADAPAMQINVAASFTVLENWPYDSSQFFDVFPFRGVWPKDWWYGNVLWLTPEGKWKTMDTVQATYDGDKGLARITGGGFFGLYSSDRGNMLMLTKGFKPALPVEYVICGNYIDYHMELKFVGGDNKPTKPAKGFQASCQYELAVWGDKTLTRDQLIEIGKQSLKAGKLVGVPAAMKGGGGPLVPAK